MRSLLFVAAAGLALSACQTTASIDEAIQDNLPAICTAAESAHAAFVVVAASGAVSERTIAREAQAYGVLQPLCINPASQTSASILVAAATAYATMTVALREAERGE